MDATGHTPERSYDVIVVGGGTSGAIAALASARCGARTLLVEKHGYLGGVLTFGMTLLGPADEEGYLSLGGIGGELWQRLRELGGSTDIIMDADGDSVIPQDPELTKLVLLQMAEEAGLELLMHALVVDVERDGATVTAVVVATKAGLMTLGARAVVDCSGDADVVALAGGRFVVGREADARTQPASRVFWVGNVDVDRMWSHFVEHPEEFRHEGDVGLVRSLRDAPGAAFAAFGPLVERAKAAGEFPIPRTEVFLNCYPDRAVARINVTRVHGIDALDPFSVTRGEVESQRQILAALQFLRGYVPGFEHAYISSAPHQLGVRESRHIVGSHVLRRDDLFEGRSFEDQIGRCSYPFDIHAVAPAEGASAAGKDVAYRRIERSFGIPLRCLLPLDVDNVAVGGRCISADHEAASSIRGQAACMVTGHAAGTVAALGAARGGALRDVPAGEVQERLRRDGAVLERDRLAQPAR